MENKNSSVRCKLVCTLARKESWGAESIQLTAVYSDDPKSENKQWSKYTPAASFSMTIDNPDAQGRFVEGKEYFADFHACESGLVLTQICACETANENSIESILAAASAAHKPGVVPGLPVDLVIRADKALRKELDDTLQKLKTLSSMSGSRNKSLSITHLEDAIMRLGMDLKELGAANPYPNSKDPSNTVVDKTADNLKL